MKTACLLLSVLTGTYSAVAQKSVTDLRPSHAAALERYMSANKKLTFLQEHNLSDEYLRSVHEWMGKTFMPNYAVGDFNRDKFTDFAVLVYREGEPQNNEGITSEEHS